MDGHTLLSVFLLALLIILSDVISSRSLKPDINIQCKIRKTTNIVLWDGCLTVRVHIQHPLWKTTWHKCVQNTAADSPSHFLWVIYDIRLQHSQNPASLLLLSTSVRISISIHQGLFSNGNLLPDCTHVMFAETASLPAFTSFLWSCRQPRSYKLYLLLAGSKLPSLEN